MLKIKNYLTASLVIVSLLSSISLTTSEAAKNNKLRLCNKKAVMAVGEKITLKLKCKGKVKWKSSNKKVASVSSKGTVTAKRKGTVKITVYNKKQKASCPIKVISKGKNKDYNEIDNTIAIPLPQPPTPVPISTLTPSPTGDMPENPVVAADIWLLFDIEQNVITKHTTTLSGTMLKCNNTVIRVKVNDVVIAEKYYYENTSTFEIQTNFSEFQVGDKIEIVREYLGEKTQHTPTSSTTVWNVSKKYVISALDI